MKYTGAFDKAFATKAASIPLDNPMSIVLKTDKGENITPGVA